MAEQKDTTSFFRKVVKFVANPSTDWADLSAATDETRENDFAKSELKAMVERKRRNDFVRKREFDMLRKMRREGLSSEQLAALGGSSKLEDSETRQPEAKGSGGVKAKIDEIEQQMVGDSMGSGKSQSAPRRAPEFYSAATQPAALGSAAPATPPPAAAKKDRSPASSRAALLQDSPIIEARPSAPPFVAAAPEVAKPAKEVVNYGNRLVDPFTVNVLEVTHDPELDESVIAFANADFEQCEQALLKLTNKNGSRAEHAETWLVLFDLYRAVGQQQKFENLAQDYAQQFGFSAPQWFSMPRLVAQAASEEQQQRVAVEPRTSSTAQAQVGWACPERLTIEGVSKLASQCLQMPMPWVFDWAALKGLDAEVCARLSELFRSWMPQRLDMQWLSGERLLTILQEMAPTGARDADPAFWVLKLDALRLANRPDKFDEAAIDYCVTYEVSPPSWEKPVCEVHISDSAGSSTTSAPPLSMVSEVSTSFMESQSPDEIHGPEVASVELSGQLVGDIGPTLRRLEGELNTATIISVSCTKLIRVDFIAAGDLLNWVLARRNENREVQFVDAQRLVALFFGAMGINEHAKVKVRMV
jgi:hypothetical protein